MPTLEFHPQDVPDGGMHTFEVGDQKVLVIRDGDKFSAYDALCPHAGADLGEGVRCGVRVICPWHHATFEASSGELIEPPALHGLTRYRLSRDGDTWRVDLNEEVAPEAPPESGKGKHTVIVGGGAAGFMAAQTLRTGGYAGRITVLSAENRAPYDRTALSKAYLSGKKPADKLPLGGPDWAQQHDIELREGVRVTAIDRQAHTVRFESGETLTYDALIVATGATPNTLKVPGAELAGIHQLRSLEDAESLKEAAAGKHLVIVGSSFIGLEAASSLVESAASVTVIGQEDEIMKPAVTPAVGKAIRALHEQHGVKFYLDAEVEGFEGSGQVQAVKLKDGERIKADLVLLGVGVQPNSDLLSDLADDKGAVPVDGNMRAAAEVYALGDIALSPTVLGDMRVEHWRVALQGGMVAAQDILQQPAPMAGRVPFFWTQQYGKSLRYVGHAESLEETHIWGDVAELKFIGFAFEEGRAVAAFGMGQDRELIAFGELLRQGRAPSADELRTGVFSLEARLA